MAPSEKPQIAWPVINIGERALIVKWSFFAQWLLSKWGVKISELAAIMASKDATMVDVLMQCFTAAVAENFEQGAVPIADFWAAEISREDDPMVKWQACVTALFEAVAKSRTKGKAQPAVTPPGTQPAVTQPGMTAN